MALCTEFIALAFIFVIKNVKLVVLVIKLIRQDVVKGSRELYTRLNLSLIRRSFSPLINRELRVTSQVDIGLCNFILHVLHFRRLSVLITQDHKRLRSVRAR